MIKIHVMHTGTVCCSIPAGTALDEAQALNSLRWIAKISRSPECVESLANHDTGVVPHEIVI